MCDFSHLQEDTEITNRLDEMIREWPSSCAFSAKAVLRQYPQLEQCRSAVIAVAAEEYLRARRADHYLDLSTFAAGFGDLEASVLRAAEVMEFFISKEEVNSFQDNDTWPAPGDRFLYFDLLEQLGGGLLSRVFIARDNAVAQRHVIVKLTPSLDREIHALGRFAHTGIVPILSIEADDVTGLSAVVMPFQSRVTLHDVINMFSEMDGVGKRDIRVKQIAATIRKLNALQPCPTAVEDYAHRHSGIAWHSEWAAETGAAIADALQAAHNQGVLHCDVKPSNIVLLDATRPILVDFNLSVGHDARRIAVGGTIPYMSQEQLCGAPIDERADVFSLAATLYHALTGEPPFGGPDQSLSAALSARISGQHRAAAQFCTLAGIDVALASVILKGLAFEPRDRYPSAASFAHALRQCVSRRSRLVRLLRRRQRCVCAAACGASLLLAGAGVWQINRDPLHVRATRAAISAAEAGDFDECFHHATAALNQDPDFTAARLIRAEAEIRRGDLHSASMDLKYAADNSDSIDIRTLRAYLQYLFVRAEDNAIVEMQMALKSGLNEAQVRNNLGYCHLLLGRLEAAAIELDSVIEREPDFVTGWLNRAVVDLRIAMRNADQPRSEFIEMAVALSPDSVDVRRVAVDVYVQDVFVGGPTRSLLERHAAEAVRLGVPVVEVRRSIGRLPEDLRSAICAGLPNASTVQHAVHTEHFVSPCNAVAVATTLLDHPDR